MSHAPIAASLGALLGGPGGAPVVLPIVGHCAKHGIGLTTN